MFVFLIIMLCCTVVHLCKHDLNLELNYLFVLFVCALPCLALGKEQKKTLLHNCYYLWEQLEDMRIILPLGQKKSLFFSWQRGKVTMAVTYSSYKFVIRNDNFTPNPSLSLSLSLSFSFVLRTWWFLIGISLEINENGMRFNYIYSK